MVILKAAVGPGRTRKLLVVGPKGLWFPDWESESVTRRQSGRWLGKTARKGMRGQERSVAKSILI